MDFLPGTNINFYAINNNFSHKIFVIGGRDIYAQALPYACTLYLTEINAKIKGDCVFPTSFKLLKYEMIV